MSVYLNKLINAIFANGQPVEKAYVGNTLVYSSAHELQDYLYFEDLTGSGNTFHAHTYGTMTTLPTMYYSTDDQKTWTQYNFANGNDLGVKGDIINIPANGKIYLKGNNTTFEESTYDLNNLNNIICLHTSASSKVGGDIRSILDETLSITTLPDYAFLGLLADNEYLVSAADLNLLINGNYSYYDLFGGDINLINPPILSSMNLADSCYSYMFYNCTSLTTAPALPATTLAKACYTFMFQQCSVLTTAPALPALTAVDSCYYNMFSDCISLETAPTIAATTLDRYSCGSMFSGCSKLVNPPTLSATNLAYKCYSYMFYNCTSLETAPTLNSTSLAPGCYQYMFDGCSKLINPPTLPATTLADYCYSYMFYNCTSLITPPALLAETMTLQCYFNMFNGCSSMTTAPTLPAMNLANYCYEGMLRETAITESPELPATTLATGCYSRMFIGCSNLNKITLAYTGDFNTTYFNEWVDGVAASGTMYYEGTDRTEAIYAIPVGWTVSSATPTIDYFCATAGAANCQVYFESWTDVKPTLYYSTDKETWTAYTMGNKITLANIGDKVYFKGDNDHMCTGEEKQTRFHTTASCALSGNLMTLLDSTGVSTTIPCDYCFYNFFKSEQYITSYPDMPATTLKPYCYNAMFMSVSGCTTFPELPAMTLSTGCYANMFYQCTSITTAPDLPATTLVEGCYNGMFQGCTGLITPPSILPATTGATKTYYNMFNGCSSLIKSPIIYLESDGVSSNFANNMFKNCSSLSEITIPNYTGSFGNAWYDWVNGVASSGTFYYNGSFTTRGTKYIPTNWTITHYPPLEYLCFTTGNASSDLSFVVNGSVSDPGLKYSYDKTSWTNYTLGSTITVAANTSIYWAGTTGTFSTSSSNYIQFHSTNNVSASGSVMSLLDDDMSITTVPNYGFYQLFKECITLLTAPKLTAEFVGDYGYALMFLFCYGLTTAPKVEATTLGAHACESMFQSCTAMTSSPSLPDASNSTWTYAFMFAYCNHLTSLPALEMTSVGDTAFNGTFTNCTSLQTGPDIWATTFVAYAFNYAFNGCSALNSIKLKNYTGSLTSGYYFSNWMNDVSASGDFYYNGNDTTHSTSAIPVGWTVRTF